MKYFSIFTGVGGFELGIKRANNISKTQRKESRRNEENSSNSKQIGLAPEQFTCVGFSENDKYCNQLLKQKFPRIKNYGDATKIIPEELPNFEFLVGGFPCQAFSIAGKRKGLQDTRGTLFHDIVRILKVKRPKYFLLENVKGLHNQMTYLIKIKDGGQGNRIYYSEGVATSLQSNSGGQGAKTGLYAVLTPDRENKRQIRRLTPTECERLQGFPDGWTEGFSDNQRYKMMGNAVTVNVIEAIMRRFG